MELNINIDTKKIKINLVLVAILFLATFLRFYHLGFQDVWLDEISTMNMTNPALSLEEMHFEIMAKEGFPDFYFIILKTLCDIFGHSIVVLRAFSAVFGVLSVLLIYLFTKEVINKRAGYIAAILLTVNPFHIYHSQEGRVYSLLMFFVILASYRLIIFIKSVNYLKAILFGIASGLILNAHPLGILNVGVLFITLLFVILSEKDTITKIKIFKQSFLAGAFTLLLAIGSYPVFSKVSKFSSFWIPEASLTSLKQTFLDLLGGHILFFYTYLFGLLIFFIVLTFKIKKSENFAKLNIVFFVLMLSWFLINIVVIILKSYIDISIILSRYFIGSLPIFIIALSYLISLVNFKIIRYVIIAVLVIFPLYFIIHTKEYYTKISKTQFDKLTKEMLQKNERFNDEIVSVWGWLFNFHIDKTTTNYFISSSLENYVADLKSNAVTKKSFWYFDGNSQPFNLNGQDKKYLEDNFILDEDITKYFDCWAKHYTSKTEIKSIEKDININLNKFVPYSGNGQGGLNMFENGVLKSNFISLSKGNYEIEIIGSSTPLNPINGENAKMNIIINNILLKNFELSEKTNSKYNFKFQHNDNQGVVIALEFLNDYSKDGLDRNVQIFSIKIKKII